MTIGFMQGRLSEPVDGRIQAFPRHEWREEFPRAAALGLRVMEWTLDADGLDENPLMTVGGQRQIRELCALHRIAIPSVTADFLMQAAPFQAEGPVRETRLTALERVIDACAKVAIRYVVWPLVDQGRLEDRASEDALVDFVSGRLAPRLRRQGVVLAFESDYSAENLSRFIEKLPDDVAGVNYDTGNSASLGYAPSDELRAYGLRVINVHVKDRVLGGGTVELGRGATDFPTLFRRLHCMNYRGHLILQTARATDGDHAGALRRYRDFVEAVMRSTEAS